MKSGKSGQREFERDKYIQKFTSKSTKRVGGANYVYDLANIYVHVNSA